MADRSLMRWGGRGSGSTSPTTWREADRNPLFGFRREIERLFDELGGGLPRFGGDRGMNWLSIAVSDGDKEVRITAEVPGMTDKDVELLVEDGVLTIRGERKSDTEDKESGYSEHYYGRFERRIALPRGVDEENAKADFRDGMLTVSLPKNEEAQRARRIPIGAEENR